MSPIPLVSSSTNQDCQVRLHPGTSSLTDWTDPPKDLIPSLGDLRDSDTETETMLKIFPPFWSLTNHNQPQQAPLYFWSHASMSQSDECFVTKSSLVSWECKWAGIPYHQHVNFVLGFQNHRKIVWVIQHLQKITIWWQMMESADIWWNLSKQCRVPHLSLYFLLQLLHPVTVYSLT